MCAIFIYYSRLVYQTRKVEEKKEELYTKLDNIREAEMKKEFEELRKRHTKWVSYVIRKLFN